MYLQSCGISIHLVLHKSSEWAWNFYFDKFQEPTIYEKFIGRDVDTFVIVLLTFI